MVVVVVRSTAWGAEAGIGLCTTMREATSRSPVVMYWTESGAPGAICSIATGAPDWSTTVVCLVTTYCNGFGLVSLLTTTVSELGTNWVKAPCVVVTVVVCASASVQKALMPNATRAAPIFFMFVFIFEDS